MSIFRAEEQGTLREKGIATYTLKLIQIEKLDIDIATTCNKQSTK